MPTDWGESWEEVKASRRLSDQLAIGMAVGVVAFFFGMCFEGWRGDVDRRRIYQQWATAADRADRLAEQLKKYEPPAWEAVR